MRQETINIYTIEDHPEPEICYEWIRNNWHDLGQHYVNDMITILEALANEIGGVLDYSISIVPDRGEFVHITDFDVEKLRELEAKKDNCPLTGKCYDIEAIDGLANGALGIQVLTTLHQEGEYIYSDEGLKEFCLANEYEFYESGKVV